MLTKINEQKNMPLITSFYAPAIAADLDGYEQIYCIICDSDLNRVWVSANPKLSRINYFAPCYKAAQRLRSYGVEKNKIFLTGFPFSLEVLGDKSLNVLRKDLGQRLFYLDPYRRFWNLHKINVNHFLGAENYTLNRVRIFTLMYAVGGAGAQKEIAGKIVNSLQVKLQKGNLKLILSAGTRLEVKEYFEKIKESAGNCSNIEIIYSESKEEYFNQFDKAIRETDVLWTKPSELVFYCGLGIPIIMTPAIGAQERCNRRWIREIQAGFKQYDPQYCDQWLFDLLHQGRLAEAAWSGFLKARKMGTYKILEVLETGKLTESVSPLER
jgi:hypothetical protein